jgi:hypothetical protein
MPYHFTKTPAHPVSRAAAENQAGSGIFRSATIVQRAGGQQVTTGAQDKNAPVTAEQERQLPHEAWPVVQQKLAHATGGGVTVIQRKVGFEFETGWDLRKPPGVSWNTKSVLASGTGWRMSPDEIDKNHAKIEFVTSPYEVDGADTRALSTEIQASFNSLKAYGDKLVALDSEQNIPDAAGGFTNVKVTPREDDLAAKPQVTGGVRRDLILNFLSDAVKEKNETSNADLMPGEGRKTPMKKAEEVAVQGLDNSSKSGREYAGTVTLLAFYIRRAYQQHEAAMEAVREWSKGYIAQMNSELNTVKKEKMRDDYLSEKMQKMKALSPSYAKGVASVLPRVRFSKLPGIQTPTLVQDVVAAAGMEEWEKGKQAWPTGLKSLRGDWATFNETIEDWLTNIQKENPAGPLKNAEFWSADEYEAGQVGSGDKKGDGILFELRGQESGLTYDNYYSYTKPYLVYFRTLNEKDKPTKA